jgi:hypothetical protein
MIDLSVWSEREDEVERKDFGFHLYIDSIRIGAICSLCVMGWMSVRSPHTNNLGGIDKTYTFVSFSLLSYLIFISIVYGTYFSKYSHQLWVWILEYILILFIILLLFLIYRVYKQSAQFDDYEPSKCLQIRASQTVQPDIFKYGLWVKISAYFLIVKKFSFIFS